MWDNPPSITRRTSMKKVIRGSVASMLALVTVLACGISANAASEQ